MIHKFIKNIKTKVLFWLAIGLVFVTFSCAKQKVNPLLALNTTSNTSSSTLKKTNPDFNKYWYAGEAEISSYKLEQARYGEIRQGHAILVYVTEDFLPNVQVKADSRNSNNIPILKLNATKKFNTGIYPYSIMQSTFYPISNNKHAIKVSSSMQEWCGHVYAQLNNREQFEIMSHSYFEGEADINFKMKKNILENELWTQLRINPKSLPTGDLQIIPSFEYTRLRHVPIKAYAANASISNNTYTIFYPDLNRTLIIKFNSNFPYDILGWEETFKSGFGNKAKIMTTKASKLETIKSAYWNKNNNKDETLRKTLQLN
ncbi:septum formation inhibitor Maf [Flavivirga aquatica]|uniref:Septum formation inhibitor Maf n=1 Tax=Flavivirga aquatica TaxID=1849968 RepID=A0A1E5SHD9_9FLAO|nr:septum formation inhibitor Maf [Flavivirga aquatica]OEJ98530.1 septum formation inhibitor Maf [Flavivirga aquatica]